MYIWKKFISDEERRGALIILSDESSLEVWADSFALSGGRWYNNAKDSKGDGIHEILRDFIQRLNRA